MLYSLNHRNLSSHIITSHEAKLFISAIICPLDFPIVPTPLLIIKYIVGKFPPCIQESICIIPCPFLCHFTMLFRVKFNIQQIQITHLPKNLLMNSLYCKIIRVGHLFLICSFFFYCMGQTHTHTSRFNSFSGWRRITKSITKCMKHLGY